MTFRHKPVRQMPIWHSRFAICASSPYDVRVLVITRARSTAELGYARWAICARNDKRSCMLRRALIWRTGTYAKPTVANWHMAKRRQVSP